MLLSILYRYRLRYRYIIRVSERVIMYDPNYDAEDAARFYDPGGRSALRAGKRKFPCPTCKRENSLTAADVKRGYQCDRCADALERGIEY